MKQFSTLICAAVAAALLPGTRATADILDTDGWSWKATITFTGYPGGETLTNFPAMVVLGSDIIVGFDYADTLPNGADLRFSDSEGNEIPYEIDTWDTLGHSIVWARVPELVDSATSINVHWGNSQASAPAYTTDGSVWANGYVGVWHLGENDARDSSPYGNHGTAVGAVTGSTGVAGAARVFDGSSSYIECGADASLNQTAGLTLESWVNPVDFLPSGVNRAMAGKAGSFFYKLNGNKLRFTTPTVKDHDSPGSSIPAAQWTHVAISFLPGSSTGMRFYQNGSLLETVAASQFNWSANIFMIGQRGNGGEYFKGGIDELRFSAGVRSADWMRASYLTMGDNSGFQSYSVGSAGSSPVVVTKSAENIDASSAGLVAELVGGALPANVVMFHGTVDGLASPGAWEASVTNSVSSLGAITNSVAGLAAGARYYFRAYATNAVGEGWSSASGSFSTLGQPTVITKAASDIGDAAARLHGEALAGNPAATTWFYWGTSDGLDDAGAWDNPPVAGNAAYLAPFYYDLPGLMANQVYYYRAFASNSFGSAWAPSSESFATAKPTVSIGNAPAVPEGALGATTQAVFTVTLSAPSAVDVSVDWVTANGTATAANNDYTHASGTLTIPAGLSSGTIEVTVIGDDLFEPNETFTVAISNPADALIGTASGTGTILNDDFNIYVRGDGLGSDNNDGATWGTAFATLQKALSAAPTKPAGRGNIAASTPVTINAQASTDGQSYDVAARTAAAALDLSFQGGWMDVDGAPEQTGMSSVEDKDGTVDEAGLSFSIAYPYHDFWRRLVFNRFAFTNVIRAISVPHGGPDRADIHLFASNIVARTQSDGIHVSYPKSYGYLGYGGYGRIVACNVDIVAGLGGSGDAIYSDAYWGGSIVTADGIDPATGNPRVSRLSAPNGTGIFFRASSVDTPSARIERTVIHGCAGPALELGATRPKWNGAPGSNVVQAVALNCTIADNGGDGLLMISDQPGAWAAITNSVFAGNAGHDVNLAGSNFTLPESHNVFHSPTGLVVNDSAYTALDASTSTDDPLFFADKDKPHPWYVIGLRRSPAFGSATPEGNRGAYQDAPPTAGLLIIIR